MMSTTQPIVIAVPERLRVVATLARLLQALEASRDQADPHQYRQVAQRLRLALAEAPHDDALETVLNAFPAAGLVYENLRYEHAGLCRQDFDRAVSAELAVRALMQRLRARA